MELFIRPLLLFPSAWRAFPILSRALAMNDLAWMYSSNKINWVKTCPRIRQISWLIDIPIIIDAFLLLDIQIRMSSSGYINVFQWNREWFFSRRVKFDSGFNVMAENEISWYGPKVIYRSTGIGKWVLRWWKRPFWFSKKIASTFSTKWVFPCRGGCSQFLISSNKIYSVNLHLEI